MTIEMLEEYAQENGIKVIYDKNFPKALNGLSQKRNEDKYIILLNDRFRQLPSRHRKIYLAHELGHCSKDLFCLKYNQHIKPLVWRYEYLAWKDAYLKIVPEKHIHKAVRKEGLCEVWELAEYFNVPNWFMYRAICYYKKVPYYEDFYNPTTELEYDDRYYNYDG